MLSVCYTKNVFESFKIFRNTTGVRSSVFPHWHIPLRFPDQNFLNIFISQRAL